MAENLRRKRQTNRGLGDVAGSGMRPRHVMAETSPSAPVSARPSAEKVSGRRERASRAAVRVDEVGPIAIAIAVKTAATSAPKVLKTRRELTGAPIDHRDAFVLSLIDGKMNVQAIVDVAAMPSSEVIEILERLTRLGIISLP